MKTFKPTILVLMFGVVAVFLTFGLQTLFNNLAIQTGITQYTFLSFLVLSGIEIASIALATFATLKVMKEGRNLDIILIYIISVAFVFAMIENTAAAFNAENIKSALEISGLRLVGATPLHLIGAGIVGLYWKQSIIQSRSRYLYYGLIIAAVFGASFNYLVILFEPYIIPLIFIIGIFLFFLYKKRKVSKLRGYK